MEPDRPAGLFEQYGVELEYMVVDRDTLDVRPLVDRLFRDVTGAPTSEVENGLITWSNELVNHVVELKVDRPVATLDGLDVPLHENVRRVNEALSRYGAILLPTGAHPWMNPLLETQLWPNEQNEIYTLYDQIFDCRGHGWSNLQSTHLNLPFRDDDEFGRLHAAIRVLLPVIPALSASTPLLDGVVMPFRDARLETYRHNQDRIPSITGKVVPEAAFTEAEYEALIFEPMLRDVGPYDPDGILDRHFLNSRGAIARFDRHSIEIRTIDIQECPAADVAILTGLVAVLKHLVAGTWVDPAALREWSEADLSAILLDVIRDGEDALITDEGYLRLFGAKGGLRTAGNLWRHLLNEVGNGLPERVTDCLSVILDEGTLSTRILRALDGDCSIERIRSVYRPLARCLAENTLFRVGSPA